MTNTALALQRFFGGFGIPAYIKDNIPDDVKMPYITYELIDPEPMTYSYFTASVWYKDTSAIEISAKVDEISAEVGRGASIPTDAGSIYLFKHRNTPFAQIMNDPNPETKRALLSMVLFSNTI